MQSLLRNLEREPAKVLASICREYEATGKAVPDQHLSLAGYSGQAMLRALLSAESIAGESGDRFALYGYRPAEMGLKYCKSICREKMI